MSSPANLIPLPVQTPIAQGKRPRFGPRQQDPQEGLCTQPWVEYFNSLVLTQSASPVRIDSVSLSAQGASIAATDMASVPLAAGIYRVSYYVRITQAATTSSSLTVTLDWTDGGVSPSFSGAAITGNTTTTFQSETQLIAIDSVSPVRYSTTYASVGGTPMLYKLEITLEKVLA